MPNVLSLDFIDYCKLPWDIFYMFMSIGLTPLELFIAELLDSLFRPTFEEAITF